jgi:hypothetical protein
MNKEADEVRGAVAGRVERHVRHFRELEFTVVAKPHSHHVEFTVYDIEGWSESGEPVWHKADSDRYPDPVNTLEAAESYLHGSVKWDGCSNWHFDEQDRVMLHGCGRRDVLRFGEVLAMCWDWAAELCPNWNA